MMLNNEQKKKLLSLTPQDITAEWLYNNIANKTTVRGGKFTVTPPTYRTNDTFYLEKGEYMNSDKILTNIGLFIYNKVIVEACGLKEVLGYHNEPLTDDVHKSVESKITEALKYDKITTEQFASYLNRIQWLGLQFNAIISPSFTMETVTPINAVMAEKKKIFDTNREKINSGDIKIAVDAERKLVGMAKEHLKDDPGYELYASGARGSFANAYKAMCVMKGPVYSNGRFHTIEKHYSEGLTKDDMEAYANAMISGQYPKSVGTQVAGYLFKRMSSGFQSVVADKPGSDCGTNLTISVTITPKNKRDYTDRYIVEAGKLVLLTSDVIDKYVGKTVNMRSVMYCKGGTTKCNKCLGEIYYTLGITNVGLSVAKAATKILNLNMKKFHDASAKLYDIDLNDITI